MQRREHRGMARAQTVAQRYAPSTDIHKRAARVRCVAIEQAEWLAGRVVEGSHRLGGARGHVGEGGTVVADGRWEIHQGEAAPTTAGGIAAEHIVPARTHEPPCWNRTRDSDTLAARARTHL